MKKLLDNKIFIGGGCFILAAILAFGALPAINKNKETTAVVCALIENVPAGTLITEELVVEREVGSYGLSNEVIRDKSLIIGKYTKTELAKDDLILSHKLAEYAADEVLDRVMYEGKHLVSVSVASIAASVSNHVKPGDYIALAAYIPAAVGTDAKVEIFPELQDIEVYGVENSKTINVDEVNAEEDDPNNDTIPATLTLIVNQEQALRLILAEYTGKLHAIFTRRGGAI